jgi:hypothetical protein
MYNSITITRFITKAYSLGLTIYTLIARLIDLNLPNSCFLLIITSLLPILHTIIYYIVLSIITTYTPSFYSYFSLNNALLSLPK